jgi:hypothetical protein
MSKFDQGSAALGAIVLGLVLVVFSAGIFAFFYGWILMLLLGTLHANIFPDVPPVGYWTCLAPAFLARLFVASNNTNVSS